MAGAAILSDPRSERLWLPPHFSNEGRGNPHRSINRTIELVTEMVRDSSAENRPALPCPLYGPES